MPLQNIGGGNHIVEVKPLEGTNSPIEQAKSLSTLMDLQAKMQMVPDELKKLQAEAQLKANEVANIDVTNAKALAEQQKATFEADPTNLRIGQALKLQELSDKVQAAKRAQLEQTLGNLSKLPEYFGQDFAVGEYALQQMMPGAKAIKGKDGVPFAVIPNPQTGKFAALPMDASKITDPVKIAAAQKSWRDEFTKVGEGYQVVDEFHNIFQRNIKLGTGAGDISAAFALMKMHDRNTRVTEGQEATQEKAPGVPGFVRDIYNKVVTGAKYGKIDSETRKQMSAVANNVFGAAKENYMVMGRAFTNMVSAAKLDPHQVILPFGGIGVEQFTKAPAQQISANPAPATEQVTVDTGSAPSASDIPEGLPGPGTKSGPTSEASLVPSSSSKTAAPTPPAAPAAAPAASKVEDTLKNMFSPPQRRR